MFPHSERAGCADRPAPRKQPDRPSRSDNGGPGAGFVIADERWLCAMYRAKWQPI